MKKKYIFIICLLLAVTATCFIFFHRKEKEIEKIVTGKVVEIQDESVLIQLENYRSVVIVGKEKLPKNSNVGDFLSITYTGGILETYPGRIEGISKIEFLEKGEKQWCHIFLTTL